MKLGRIRLWNLTDFASIDSNGYQEVSIRGYPASGLIIKAVAGDAVDVNLSDGTNIVAIKQAQTAASVSTYILPVQDVDEEGRSSKVDSITKSRMNIDHPHSKLHDGTSFSAYYTITTAATNGHRSGLYIKTPITTPLCHLVASFAANAAADLSICEEPTIASNTGTHANVIYNRYRDNATASGCYDNATSPAINKYTTLTEAEIAGDATWAMGTVIRTEPLAPGAAPRAAGGVGRDAQEYILKANTKYVFLITNTSATATTHYILVDWYEHTNV